MAWFLLSEPRIDTSVLDTFHGSMSSVNNTGLHWQWAYHASGPETCLKKSRRRIKNVKFKDFLKRHLDSSRSLTVLHVLPVSRCAVPRGSEGT